MPRSYYCRPCLDSGYVGFFRRRPCPACHGDVAAAKARVLANPPSAPPAPPPPPAPFAPARVIVEVRHVIVGGNRAG